MDIGTHQQNACVHIRYCSMCIHTTGIDACPQPCAHATFSQIYAHSMRTHVWAFCDCASFCTRHSCSECKQVSCAWGHTEQLALNGLASGNVPLLGWKLELQIPSMLINCLDVRLGNFGGVHAIPLSCVLFWHVTWVWLPQRWKTQTGGTCCLPISWLLIVGPFFSATKRANATGCFSTTHGECLCSLFGDPILCYVLWMQW